MVRFFLNSMLLCFISLAFGQELKLMTYNIRLDLKSDSLNQFDNRKEKLANQINFYEPHILGTQEGLPHQIKYLSENLKGYENFGLGRDGDSIGESVSIFYKKDRLNLIDQNTFWLSETPEEVSMGWDAKYNRICTYGLFEDTKTEIRFWIFNTHLDHYGNEARKNGIATILDKIRAVNTENLTVIVMGDFNLEPDNHSLKQFSDHFKDARESSIISPFGPLGTFNAFSKIYPFERRIDYIYISRNTEFSVQKYAVFDDQADSRFPSDHFPVYVELRTN